jgi:hypothetical protein
MVVHWYIVPTTAGTIVYYNSIWPPLETGLISHTNTLAKKQAIHCAKN